MIDKNLSLVVVNNKLITKKITNMFKLNMKLASKVLFIFTVIVLIKTITG